jgi:ribosomal protein S17
VSHHDLKILPGLFKDLIEGRKRHEVRKFDRDFKTGDTVTLHEFQPIGQTYSGRTSAWVIGSVTQPGTWGLPDDVGVFSLLTELPATASKEGVK